MKIKHQKQFLCEFLPVSAGFFQSDLKIEAQSCFGIRAYLTVSDRNMRRMDGVTLECCFVFKRGIKHDVCIGGGQAFGVDLDVKKTGDLSRKSFQTFLDACLDGGLFLWCTCPEGTDMNALIKKFVAGDIAVVPGSTFMPDVNTVSHSFRMNYSMPTKEQIVKGVGIMGNILKDFL